MFFNTFTNAFDVLKRLPSLSLSTAVVCYSSFATAALVRQRNVPQAFYYLKWSITLHDCPSNIRAQKTLTLGLEFCLIRSRIQVLCQSGFVLQAEGIDVTAES